MTIRTSICAMAMAMAAAAGGNAAADTLRKTKPTPSAARHVRAAAYSTAPATLTWPTTAKRRQLVISRGWRGDENYVWFIADGRTVVSVFLTATREELGTAIAKFARDMTFATVGSPTDSLSWGIAGAIIKVPPPPPPPEPGGLPEWYVDQVMQTAMRMDDHVLGPLVLTPTVLQQPGVLQVNPGSVQKPGPQVQQPGQKAAKP